MRNAPVFSNIKRQPKTNISLSLCQERCALEGPENGKKDLTFGK